MNQYETVFILNPVLSEKQIEEATQKYVSFIKTQKRETIQPRKLGIKKASIYNREQNNWILPSF